MASNTTKKKKSEIENNLLDDYIDEHPLLTEEEEIEYGKNLSLLSSLNLAIEETTKLDESIVLLDVDKLFISCENCKDYETVISLLTQYYRTKLGKVEESTYFKLKKYLRKSQELQRSLTKDELQQLYNVKVENSIDSESLLSEAQKFVAYKTSFDVMFDSNMRLVARQASSYCSLITDEHCGFDKFDLINEGSMGLIRAIKGYDISKGCKFSTYAFDWIKQKMLSALAINTDLIIIPKNLNMDIISLKKKIAVLERKTGKRLTFEEIAETFDVPLQKVGSYLTATKVMVPIDQPINDEEDIFFADILADSTDVEKQALNSILIDELSKCMTPREFNVLKQRFVYEKTLDAVGEELSVTRERARQIEAKALKKAISFKERQLL